MKSGPNIAALAALIGEPARANMLTALMSGKALTATELAHEAGITAQTASSHLRKLQEADLITLTQQGRHRYFTLGDDDVATAIEALMGLAASRGHLRTRTGPKDPDLRRARVCYNHLAGEMGVQMYRSMCAQSLFDTNAGQLDLSPKGAAFVTELGLDLTRPRGSKTPICRECLDWSMRQSHLAGHLGRALLSHFITLGWAVRVPDSRIIRFNRNGQAQFNLLFGENAPTRGLSRQSAAGGQT